jgi:hypothetical protein
MQVNDKIFKNQKNKTQNDSVNRKQVSLGALTLST